MRYSLHFALRLCFCLVLAVPAYSSQAAEFGDWRINGFGTLGATYNPDDQVEFTRDLFQDGGAKDGWSAEPDSMLGVQFVRRQIIWDR